MCGIVGLVTKTKYGFSKEQQKVFYQLLYADALRGVDATGVITAHNNGDFGIMKEASEAVKFLDSFVDSDLDKDLFKNGFAVVGHNRASTVGEDVDANAHPFVEDGTFAMVHNGTLYNHKKLHDTVVDSHALAITIKRAFDDDDYKKSLETALQDVYGAYACVWYDQKRDQIGMVRNKERPLFIAQTSNSVLFGSEAGLLSWIAGRCGVKIDKVESVPVDTLITIQNNNGGVVVHTPLTLTAPTTHKTGTGHGKEKTSNGNSPFRSFVQKAVSGDTGSSKVLSKSAFKRWKKSAVGELIRFVRDDYKDNIEGKSKETRYLWGYNKHLDFKHEIRCTVDISDFGYNSVEFDYEDNWEGFIEDAHYQTETGKVIIFLELPMPTTIADNKQ